MDQCMWNSETARWVIAQLSKGKSDAEIAAERNCDVESISRQIDLLVLHHHRVGETHKQIAKKLHVSPARVHRVVANHHIEKGEITMDDLVQYYSLNPAPQKSDDSQKILALCAEIRDMLAATNLSLGPDLDQRMVRAGSVAISDAAKRVVARAEQLSSE